MLSSYKPSEVDRRISPGETMGGDNYFSIGESAVDVVVKACMASQLTEVNRVLDMPCGHGRVLRHLVRLFPPLPYEISRKWLAFLAGLLREKGIVVATFHGRWSTQRPYRYTDDHRW